MIPTGPVGGCMWTNQAVFAADFLAKHLLLDTGEAHPLPRFCRNWPSCSGGMCSATSVTQRLSWSVWIIGDSLTAMTSGEIENLGAGEDPEINQTQNGLKSSLPTMKYKLNEKSIRTFRLHLGGTLHSMNFESGHTVLSSTGHRTLMFIQKLCAYSHSRTQIPACLSEISRSR